MVALLIFWLTTRSRSGEPDNSAKLGAAHLVLAESKDHSLPEYSAKQPGREPIKAEEPVNTGHRESRVAADTDAGDLDAQGPSNREMETNEVQLGSQIVRRSFPVSPSVERQCATQPIPNGEECDVVKELLGKMMLERRDETWASSTEAKLRDHAAQISTDVEIRALECRDTLCAMEISTVMGNLDLLSWRQVMGLGVDDHSHFLMGYEPEPSGARRKIFLRVYERR